MEYKLKINDNPVTVEAGSFQDGASSMVTGGVVYDVRCTRLDDHQLHITVNGKGIRAFISGNGSGKTVMIDGMTYFIEDTAHPSLSKPGRKKSTGIPDSVTPPMPAVVTAVLVNVGDTVVKGQGVVVVSAMKMETTLSAPYDGVVKDIKAAQGDKVNPGDILVDIEKTQESNEE
jgi:biotin carboxyl carrier protein